MLSASSRNAALISAPNGPGEGKSTCRIFMKGSEKGWRIARTCIQINYDENRGRGSIGSYGIAAYGIPERRRNPTVGARPVSRRSSGACVSAATGVGDVGAGVVRRVGCDARSCEGVLDVRCGAYARHVAFAQAAASNRDNARTFRLQGDGALLCVARGCMGR